MVNRFVDCFQFHHDVVLTKTKKGNLPAMYRADEMTEPHFEWTEKYGSVLRLHEEFNVSRQLSS